MGRAVILRPEHPGEAAAIRHLTEDAFRDKPFSDGTEGAIIDRLRAEGVLAISTVAVEGGDILGHVAFSPASIGAQGGWFTLGPIAVRADHQGKGIGAALIENGLAQLRARGARGVVLIGDPDYYGRFGFRAHKTLTFGGKPDRHVQALAFCDESPSGEVHFHPAFGDPP